MSGAASQRPPQGGRNPATAARHANRGRKGQRDVKGGWEGSGMPTQCPAIEGPRMVMTSLLCRLRGVGRGHPGCPHFPLHTFPATDGPRMVMTSFKSRSGMLICRERPGV